ncbi:HD domain-containing protein [Thiothrix eikelboomii]|uniref:HD domain-containing protein n=1 Tax=Thiothrix eikelboomii TaxID=92487 RepID=A0A1T4VRN0_9GAMM|nr:HD domain-containing protein [Thiothrix eikelboomii]SKA67518.1 HD domain-containing protein [Thiothrix eikelboomii]
MPNLWSQDLFTKAWEYAAVAHHGQTYSTPVEGLRMDYLAHVGAVAMELMHGLVTEQQGLEFDYALQCALLHDVLEDTPRTYPELVAEFGQKIADGVAALSKNPDLPRTEQMLDSLQRIQQQPKEVWVVKLADRINNLSAPPAHWTYERKLAYQAEAQVIYDHLHSAHALLAQRLSQKIANYSQYLTA